MRLRLRLIDWPATGRRRRTLVLTDTPRPNCPVCHGAGGVEHEYGHPETGEYEGSDWEPCLCWTGYRPRILLPLPLPRRRRTPPGGYSDEPPF
ncbi:hypothetical protein [Streptomyces sp. NRRL F-5135]|uniref:hypothetical protein n=1 Tax=Streptomyces sp. NRRL F-5135 TaxID=1463858 RepID=UPI0004C76BE2|nr:hypothetical protein [Streptomyces sp. NRRL F-5135]